MSYTASINGLIVNNEYMNVLSNNIANASTIGFKSSTPIFYNVVPYSFYSQNNVGSGSAISGFTQNFSNGALIDTGRDLDIRILEEGFFRVIDKQGNLHYTRNGQFLLDENKNLVNTQGMYLTGKNRELSNKNVYNSCHLEPINLKSVYTLESHPTSKIKISAILNSSQNFITNNTDNANEDILQISDSFNEISICNKDEKIETINLSFNKIDKNIWRMNIKSNDLYDTNTHKKIDQSVDLKFNQNGQLISDSTVKIPSKDDKHEDIILHLSDITEQSNPESSNFQAVQDGYKKGSLTTFEILPNGEMIGTYSNEKIEKIGQIFLSQFINPGKLNPENGNMWSATKESGKESIGIPGHAGFSLLNTKSLEASNVDLNKELINMIIAQRNYQSNAQAFKAEDRAINTLINLR